MAPQIDASGFLYDEIRQSKRRMEEAMRRGDLRAAARHARRTAELLRSLAQLRKWGSSELLELAREYEELARSLERQRHAAQRPRHGGAPGRPSGEGAPGEGALGELDEEFERQAEALVQRANVTWDDIAGLEDVKRSLIEALFYSLARPEKPGVRVEPPRRFLLYGPPGTGKTMLAMAASSMLGATFMHVSVDRVLSRYVGDSPRMISAIFRVARRRAPTVVFFDEVETLMMRRDTGREAATGLVQTLLTELDGFASKSSDRPVIVIAATNKPWMLDEAIISRFEKRIYVPLPDREAREQIFRLNLEKKGFALEGITYSELAEITEGYSGRDIANACREAVMMMLRRANPDIYERLRSISDARSLSRLRFRVLPVRREEILEALRRVKPAVTREDLRRYEEWARRYGGGPGGMAWIIEWTDRQGKKRAYRLKPGEAVFIGRPKSGESYERIPPGERKGHGIYIIPAEPTREPVYTGIDDSHEAPVISRHHVMLRVKGGELEIIDHGPEGKGSTNETLVNGEKLPAGASKRVTGPARIKLSSLGPEFTVRPEIERTVVVSSKTVPLRTKARGRDPEYSAGITPRVRVLEELATALRRAEELARNGAGREEIRGLLNLSKYIEVLETEDRKASEKLKFIIELLYDDIIDIDHILTDIAELRRIVEGILRVKHGGSP